MNKLRTAKHVMILSWEVGNQSDATGIEFLDDLRSRLASRIQLTTEMASRL
ncbi:MAG: hypothetical protein OXI87_20800 [Albidovulum sp.]|nr:hypothetical protein [Albidovulum sp.]